VVVVVVLGGCMFAQTSSAEDKYQRVRAEHSLSPSPSASTPKQYQSGSRN